MKEMERNINRENLNSGSIISFLFYFDEQIGSYFFVQKFAKFKVLIEKLKLKFETELE